ncbi:hypothetical protein Tsp_14583, partial [Trichinella spiralis]|uniref:hypothetical protein n=1 Tax=Trichinella spiralis TaxID=6334 RepID=UPI0001EFD284
MIQTTLRQLSSAGVRIDLSSVRFDCGLRHPMNLVPFATRVHMGLKALPCRPSVPFRSRWHSQIAFNTVLMIIVFNVLVRNCEDESRILNDLHRITYLLCCCYSSSITFYNMASSRDSVKYWYVASGQSNA